MANATSHNRAIGSWGERLAAEHLIANGLELLERNYRSPYGEIDLIARQDNIVVFVEVKTRSSDAFGWPESALTKRKREHLLQAALYYLQQHPEISDDWRVDIIAIRGNFKSDTAELVWFENVLA